MPDPSRLVTVPTVTDPTAAPDGSTALYVLEPVPHTGAGIDWPREPGPMRERLHAFLEAGGYPTDVRGGAARDARRLARPGACTSAPRSPSPTRSCSPARSARRTSTAGCPGWSSPARAPSPASASRWCSSAAGSPPSGSGVPAGAARPVPRVVVSVSARPRVLPRTSLSQRATRAAPPSPASTARRTTGAPACCPRSRAATSTPSTRLCPPRRRHRRPRRPRARARHRRRARRLRATFWGGRRPAVPATPSWPPSRRRCATCGIPEDCFTGSSAPCAPTSPAAPTRPGATCSATWTAAPRSSAR